MKNVIKLVGVIVEINGKKKNFTKEQCYFHGWSYENEDLMESDSGVDLEVKDGNKRYKVDVG
jgi:hypothetical protein